MKWTVIGEEKEKDMTSKIWERERSMRMDTSPLPTEIKRGCKCMFQWKKVLCFLTPVNVWVKSESACHLLCMNGRLKLGARLLRVSCLLGAHLSLKKKNHVLWKVKNIVHKGLHWLSRLFGEFNLSDWRNWRRTWVKRELRKKRDQSTYHDWTVVPAAADEGT